MSPEQARGISVDGRADLFSLGLVIFYCLTGELLYHGDTTYELLVKAATGPGSSELARIAALPAPVRATSCARRWRSTPPAATRARPSSRAAVAPHVSGGAAQAGALMSKLFADDFRAEEPRFAAAFPSERGLDRPQPERLPAQAIVSAPETPQPPHDSRARPRDRPELVIAHIAPSEAIDEGAAIYRTRQPCRALGELPEVGGRQRVDPVAGAARHAHPARRRRAGDSRRRAIPICCPSSRRAAGSGGCRSTRSPATCSPVPQGSDAAERSVGSGRTQPAAAAGAPGRLPAVRDARARGARSRR